jgi:hypothetical protein
MAFLYGAKFANTDLTRNHVRGVIGEEITNFALARDTYAALSTVFAGMGHDNDAKWALRRAAKMESATHRPGSAHKYYRAPLPSKSLARAAFNLRHAALWLAGPAREMLAYARGM